MTRLATSAPPPKAPHTPLSVNEEWKGKSGLNLYADFVMETDALIGRVLAALAASGAADNTLVLFTADNGCAPYIGISDLEKMGHYPSGPLRGAKADAWEGGHRVPFIVRWPAQVKGGQKTNQLTCLLDFMATTADILGRCFGRRRLAGAGAAAAEGAGSVRVIVSRVVSIQSGLGFGPIGSKRG